MSRILLMGPKEKEAIKTLVAYAESHRIDEDLLIKCLSGEWAAGDDPNYACYVEQGYRIVYSIEQQPSGWYRHLSVSVDDSEKYPNPVAVEMLMKEFGYKGGIKDCHVSVEERIRLATGLVVNAINVLQEY